MIETSKQGIKKIIRVGDIPALIFVLFFSTYTQRMEKDTQQSFDHTGIRQWQRKEMKNDSIQF